MAAMVPEILTSRGNPLARDGMTEQRLPEVGTAFIVQHFPGCTQDGIRRLRGSAIGADPSGTA